MKPQEAELVTEISKLQCMVSELKTGFTSALTELSQIQHGDTFLREELEENRRSCQKKALRLEALVESLREELGAMQSHIVQLHSNTHKPQQDGKSSKSKQRESRDAAAEATAGRSRRECECPASPPVACLSRGKLLLHCFLQGLKAGLSEGTDARHQVAMQLLHSEWEYVSTLNQLYDRYKTPPAHQATVEPYQAYQTFVEKLLQRHLIFRNTLQERLTAEHWKSLVGDILVQLIGQNDTAFSDMYLGYTTTLASFLSLEFNRLNQTEKGHKVQGGQMETQEMKLLSLLLAPVSRVHGYLTHIQSLLQWTGKEHPDCSLLLGTERALRGTLSRCHAILEQDVRWGEGAGQSSCSDAASSSESANCCSRDQPCGPQSRESQAGREESHSAAAAAAAAAHRDNQHVGLTNGVDVHRGMRVECWSCSPVRRRKGGGPDRHPARDCGHAHCCCSLLAPDAAGWGENSDSGQGTFSQPTGRGTNEPPGNHSETDPDDTSAFDFSSVTSCSPDGTLCRDTLGSNSGVEDEEEEDEEEEEEEEEEEDSQVPVLLKPSYSHQQQPSSPRERTVCLRWQIPRSTPHPPLRKAAGSCADGPTPCLVSSRGKRLLSVRRGSPPPHLKSAFRPIWDDPSKQVDSAPEKENRQGFVPIQAPTRQNFHNFNLSRENLRPGPAQQRGHHTGATLWDDSEDSEGPCSTV